MKIHTKLAYEAPKTVLRGMDTEGIICASVEAIRSDYGDAEEQEW